MDASSTIMIEKNVAKSKVKMALALSVNGTPIHINNAANGKACNATCIGCGCPVIAKNRGKVAYHYSHDPKYYDPDQCNWSPETELHLMAKMVIAEDKKLHVPIGTIEPTFEDVHFEDVKLEKRVGNRIPDIVAYANGELIRIEIAVTHPCDTAKISEMKREYANCVEIDLSEFGFEEQTLNLNTVREFIQQAPIKWLSISPVGDIGQMTYNHNLNLQRSLAAQTKGLSEELKAIRADECAIRRKHQDASDALKTLQANVDKQTIQYNEQKNIISKNRSQLERLENFDRELNRFATVKENYERKIQALEEKEQALDMREDSIREKEFKLTISMQRLDSSKHNAEKEDASKIRSEVEAEFKEKKRELERGLENLSSAKRDFDKVVETRAEEMIETIKRQLHSEACQQKNLILNLADGARKRAHDLIQPLPVKLKIQFDKARAFAKPPYEVIEEIEEIISRLSKRDNP